jgi:hypothetical protein
MRTGDRGRARPEWLLPSREDVHGDGHPDPANNVCGECPSSPVPPDVDQMADIASASEKPRAYLDHAEIG